jgi:ABC-2 type transport system ATP-binding protein
LNAAESLIAIHDLQKTYPGRWFRKGFQALRGVSFDVGRGSIFGLLGPNGAGKTTLIKVLMGLAPSWEGQATIFGLSAGDPRARRRIGFLPEAHRLPGYLTGIQVLRLYAMYSGRSRPWVDERMPGWLETVDMQRDAHRKVREYSKGMQQRIGLAQALIHEPELVFLDEPTDGVDPVGRAMIRTVVQELRDKGTTVFINSHLLMEVEQICDRVVIMSKGRIIREGTVKELTPSTGWVEFRLTSVPEDLDRLLAAFEMPWKRTEEGFAIDCDRALQNEVIDRLRASSVAIDSIARRKLTLEESFIDLVTEKAR